MTLGIRVLIADEEHFVPIDAFSGIGASLARPHGGLGVLSSARLSKSTPLSGASRVTLGPSTGKSAALFREIWWPQLDTAATLTAPVDVSPGPSRESEPLVRQTWSAHFDATGERVGWASTTSASPGDFEKAAAMRLREIVGERVVEGQQLGLEFPGVQRYRDTAEKLRQVAPMVGGGETADSKGDVREGTHIVWDRPMTWDLEAALEDFEPQDWLRSSAFQSLGAVVGEIQNAAQLVDPSSGLSGLKWFIAEFKNQATMFQPFVDLVQSQPLSLGQVLEPIQPQLESYYRVVEDVRYLAETARQPVSDLESFEGVLREVGTLGVTDETPESRIKRLYDDLAQLSIKRLAGDNDRATKREIEQKAAELRRLQSEQAAKIREAFVRRFSAQDDAFARRDRADEFLRRREDPASSDRPSE